MKQQFMILKVFDGSHILRNKIAYDNQKQFTLALALASHMADSSVDDADDFARFCSALNEDSWNYALAFAPFNKVHGKLETLKTIVSAMEEALLALDKAASGVAFSILNKTERDVRRHEKSLAVIAIMNFISLYSSQIDVCRALRSSVAEILEVRDSKRWERRIVGMTKKRADEHAFTKDCRNYMLHYELISPNAEVSIGERTKTINMYLNTHSLLNAGYKWKAGSRRLLSSTSKLDIRSVFANILDDVRRIVEFHQRVANKKLKPQRKAFEHYRLQRERFCYLQKAHVNIGKAFGKPVSILNRLVSDDICESVLNSNLSNDAALDLLKSFANRFDNLPTSKQEELEAELRRLLQNRIPFPQTGRYLGARDVSKRNSFSR